MEADSRSHLFLFLLQILIIWGKHLFQFPPAVLSVDSRLRGGFPLIFLIIICYIYLIENKPGSLLGLLLDLPLAVDEPLAGNVWIFIFHLWNHVHSNWNQF